MENSIALKKCSRCHMEKPVTDFSRDRNLTSGYTSACKLCLKNKAPRIEIDVSTPTAKECKKCHIEKPLEDFYEHKGYKYGRDTVCKSCTCVIAAEKYREQHEPEPQAVNGGKICYTCHVEKPFDEFTKNTRMKDGHASSCKSCHNAKAKQHLRDIGKRRIPMPLPEPTNGGKVCARCLTEKPADCFCRSSRYEDGSSKVCKTCANKRNKENSDARGKPPAKDHTWYESNKERHAALTRKWREEHSLHERARKPRPF